MGLHSPFGYIGYDVTCLDMMFYIIDKLCDSCHTNEDYRPDRCKGCPAGVLWYECKDYIMTHYYCSKKLNKSDRIMKQLQKVLKNIELHPGIRLTENKNLYNLLQLTEEFKSKRNIECLMSLCKLKGKK